MRNCLIIHLNRTLKYVLSFLGKKSALISTALFVQFDQGFVLRAAPPSLEPTIHGGGHSKDAKYDL